VNVRANALAVNSVFLVQLRKCMRRNVTAEHCCCDQFSSAAKGRERWVFEIDANLGETPEEMDGGDLHRTCTGNAERKRVDIGQWSIAFC
jgi:hypothetical protein